MITQQAKDHAQACYIAMAESRAHQHMGDAQRAAYMTILSRHMESSAVPVPGPKPSPPLKDYLKAQGPSQNKMHGSVSYSDCICPNCTRARSIKPLIGGREPCSGYEPPEKGRWWMLWALAALVGIVPMVAAFVTGVKLWQS